MNRFNFAKDVTSGIATVAGAVTMFSKSKTSKEKSELEKKDIESKIAKREADIKNDKAMTNVARMNARSNKAIATASAKSKNAYADSVQQRVKQSYAEAQALKNSEFETTNSTITGKSEVENGINND